MAEHDVLIVGAGPTGLVLAICLTRLGARVRIIDKTQGPGTTSRAMVLHARNLEFYRQFGFADAAIEGGIRFKGVNLWAGGKHAGRIAFEDVGPGLSRYPFPLVYPQDQHEQMLVGQLARLGVGVERETELLSFQTVDGGVRARLKGGGVHQARFVAGCDGARSTVREELGVGFPGGTYADLFYVADVIGSGPPSNGDTHVALDEADILAVFPMKGPGRMRLVGSLREPPAEELRWEDVSKRIIEHLRLKIDEVRWFSTYRVHHRVASAFRRGPVFLLGDAAHIHSPVGGQGMNTGIGDAVNLGWKLAAVLQNRIDPEALDTFETERIAFARQLVSSTDKAFEFINNRGPIAEGVRLHVVPFLLPKLFSLRAGRRLLFKTVSQLAVKYPDSPLSAGPEGGDRLPWISFGDDGDNYAPLSSFDWQVHCYGEAPPEVRELCGARGMPLHVFPSHPGIEEDAVYLVRPDGHIGLDGASALGNYLDEHKILPR